MSLRVGGGFNSFATVLVTLHRALVVPVLGSLGLGCGVVMVVVTMKVAVDLHPKQRGAG